LPERDLVAARHALDVAADRVVETELALVCQHEKRGDREGLAVAADPHVEVGGHRLAGRRVAHAERPHIRLASILPDADDGAGNRCALHREGDRLVERGRTLVGGIRMGDRRRERARECGQDRDRAQ
jgi:hypothetical protein